MAIRNKNREVLLMRVSINRFFSLAVISLFVILLSAACNRTQGPVFLVDIGITSTGTGEGSLPSSSSTASGAYPAGTGISVKAAPDTGSKFTGWYNQSQLGVLISEDNPYTAVLNDHIGIFARFDTDITRYDLSTWESIGIAGWGISVSANSLPNHFQIWNAAEGTVEMDVLSLVYNPALRRNPVTMEWEPWLAESFSADASSVTVTLRDGLYWSDGNELTADDFIFAADVYQSGEVTVARDISVNGEATVWIKDGRLEYSVYTTGLQPYGSLIEIAALPPLPEHVLGPIVDTLGMSALNDRYGLNTDPEVIVGNGPFVPKEINLGESVLLWKNPYYFEKDAEGLPIPYVSGVRFVPAVGDPVDLFNSGATDVCGVSGAGYESVDRSGAAVLKTGLGNAQILFLNQNPVDDDGGVAEPAYSWLTNTAFRQAIGHIVNRSRIIDEAYSTHASAVYLPVHPESSYYQEAVEANVLTYSTASAETLLEGLGWIDTDADNIREDGSGNPLELTLIAPSSKPRIEILCNIVAEEAAAVGISIEVVLLSSTAFSQKLYADLDWELACAGFPLEIDPSRLDTLIPSYGADHLSEPDQDAPRQTWEQNADLAWQTVMETPDGAGRAAALETIQQIWADEVPWIYIAAPNIYEAYHEDLSNISQDAYDGSGWQSIVTKLFYD